MKSRIGRMRFRHRLRFPIMPPINWVKLEFKLGTPLVCNNMAMQYQMWNYQMQCNYAQQY